MEQTPEGNKIRKTDNTVASTEIININGLHEGLPVDGRVVLLLLRLVRPELILRQAQTIFKAYGEKKILVRHGHETRLRYKMF